MSNSNKEGSKAKENPKESQLVTEIWENLNKEEFVKTLDLFLFLLAIVNLIDPYITSKFNEKSKENNSLDENFVLNLEKNIDVDQANFYINSRITQKRKYGGFDQENNYLLNFSHGKSIHRDFNMLYINRNKNIANMNKQNKKSASISIPQFKPTIGVVSEKLSHEYKKKIANENGEIYGNNAELMSYLDILMHKKQQSINKNNKLLEDMKKKEIECCTFAPKINSIPLKDYNSENRIEFLYKEGIQKNSKRTKILTKEEMELMKYPKEFTFRPEIAKRERAAKASKNQNVNQENPDCIKLYERLKKGREVIYC